jgi:hypothetical protein
MTRVRIGLVAVVVALAASGTVAATAVAAPGGQGSANARSFAPLYKMPMHGVAKGGKKFSGTYGIQRFVVATVNGKRGVYALGTLTATLKGKHVTRNNVMLPAKLTGATSTTKSTRQAATTCTVLHLVLGPINLDLLGLNVAVGGGIIPPGSQAAQPITINITADPTGGLLGQLLCGLTNSLGGSLSTLSGQLNQLSATLTSLVSLLGGA